MKQLFTILLLTVPLFAHDLYLMPDQFTVAEGATITVAVHNGDTFPESEVSPVLDRVRDLKLVSSTGSTDLKNVRVEDKAVKGEAALRAKDGIIVTVQTVPYAFSLPAGDFESYLKEEGLSDVIEWRKQHGKSKSPGRERYSKYAKALISTGAGNKFHSQAVGMPIEIVPDRSPVGMKAGESLPVRVLFRGKPASGLQIESTWAGSVASPQKTTVGHTDTDGRITVPLKGTGMWRLHTIRMERCSEPAIAEWESYWASLTFEVR